MRARAQERHVDLHCWIAFFTRLLATLAERLGMTSEHQHYSKQLEELLTSLVALHWNPRVSAFCDWGRHANAGDFRNFYVVKCATR